jgi:hypothetical protein
MPLPPAKAPPAMLAGAARLFAGTTHKCTNARHTPEVQCNVAGLKSCVWTCRTSACFLALWTGTKTN